MKRKMFFIGLSLLLVSISARAEQSHSHEHKWKLLKNSDEGYHTRVSMAPAHIPGLSGESTPEEIEFNKKILGHPQKCLFQGEDSVEGEGWVNTARVKVLPKFENNHAKNSEEFLKACKTIQRELGPKSCSVIEIAGHANGVSVGLGKIFGFRLTEGEWEHLPKDNGTFKEIVECIQDISWESAPIVFCSCGAATVEDDFPIEKMRGQKLHYAHKQEAQQLMSNILNRKVISANGAENLQDWGKHCRNGWCITDPAEKVSVEEIKQLGKLLPEPKVQWDVHGNPLH
jgi:hypothetical protein